MKEEVRGNVIKVEIRVKIYEGIETREELRRNRCELRIMKEEIRRMIYEEKN